MRITHVINGLGPGGAERSLVELLPFYRDAGIESTVVHLKDRAIGFGEEARGIDCTVRRLPGTSLREWVPAFRRYVSEARPDLVHTSLLNAHIVARLGAARTGVPVLSSLVNTAYDPSRAHDPHLNQLGFRVWKAVDGATARHLTSHFHAITHAVKASYVSALGLDPQKVTVVGRGRSRKRLGEATAERRAEVRNRLGLPEGRTVLVNVGRQEFQKGQMSLMQAMPSIVEGHPDTILLVAGRPGSETHRLHDEVVRHRLQDHVRFLGHRDDVTDITAASDVFVFPSLFEGLGGSVIEAMGLGKPVVASDIPVLREVLGDTGVFVAPEVDASGVPSPEASGALANAVLELIRDPERREALGRAAERRFAERFEIGQTARGMVELYRSVTA